MGTSEELRTTRWPLAAKKSRNTRLIWLPVSTSVGGHAFAEPRVSQSSGILISEALWQTNGSRRKPIAQSSTRSARASRNLSLSLYELRTAASSRASIAQLSGMKNGGLLHISLFLQ